MSTGRVLILDDDTRIVETLSLLVEHAGHEARGTTSATEFFALHESWAPTHLVIDLRMPGMDGIDVLTRLADEDCQASIVISSGVESRVLDAARRYALENGLTIAGVLPKPFSLLTLSPLLDSEGQQPQATGPVKDGLAQAFDPSEFRTALGAPDQISLVYQPKVTVADQRLSGFEALARWHHPVHGPISPAQFVPAAERAGLVQQLTIRVIELALPWFAGLAAPHLSLSVNVSALCIGDPAFAATLRQRCRDHAVEPERIILELTETASPQHETISLRNLTRMRVAGFRLSLDDFGTGYSSLSQLARLPFSEIKIDRSFVSTATVSEESRLMVASVIDLGRSLGLVTVAEGVEDAETLALLQSLGCDLAQGYFMSRPMLPDDAAVWGG